MHLIINANATHIPLADQSVQCIVTSPPYWQLRDYGYDGQIGHERIHDCLGWATGKDCGECYICHMRAVGRELWRVLKKDGTCWINIGDTYAGSGGAHQNLKNPGISKSWRRMGGMPTPGAPNGVKAKDMCLIPQRLALALQADGWWVRNEVIWHKPAVLPENVKDRCTRAHEQIWLLTRAQRYYHDFDSIQTPAADSSLERLKYDGPRIGRPEEGNSRLASGNRWDPQGDANDEIRRKAKNAHSKRFGYIWSNARDVWTIHNQGTHLDHFATYPEMLPKMCILAGSRPGDLVLDPFAGSMTTGIVATRLGRGFVGIEMGMAYIQKMAVERMDLPQPGML